MKHLAPEEFVDAAEGMLPQSRAAHLNGCDACRAQADAIGVTLREVAAVEPNEPSPLFWQHFSGRVHDAIAHERIALRPWWSNGIAVRVLAPLAAIAALVIAVVSGGMLSRLAPNPAVAPRAVETAAAAPSTETEAAIDPDNAEVWAVLTAA